MDFFSRIAERAMGTQPIVHPIRNRSLGVEGGRIEESAQEDLGRQPELLQNRVEQGPTPVPPVADRTLPRNHQEKEIEQTSIPNKNNPIQEPASLLPDADRTLPRNYREREIEHITIPNKKNYPLRDFSTDEQTGTSERNQNVAVRPDVQYLQRPRVEEKQTQQREALSTAAVFSPTTKPTKFESRIQQPQRVREETEVKPEVSVFGDHQESWPAPRQRSEPNQTSWGRKSLQGSHSEPPTIKVTIGRVEVRAIQESTPPPKPKVSKAKPGLSLETYLEQRKRGER